MGACKICKVERDSLTDGRCRSCQMVYEASRNKMTYGKYVDTLPKVPVPVKAEVKLETEEYNKCRFCGAYIEPWQKICSSYECQIKRKNERYEKQKARKKGEIEMRRCCICGRKFTPKSSSARYCSDQCRKEGKRRACRTYKGSNAG